MAEAHAERDHATWSASSTERNWLCPGALALTDNLPESTSEAADWGTCAHEIGEACLRDDKLNADSFIGRVLRGKSHEFEVDEEMAETAQTYVDYCRQRVADYKAETGKNALRFVEERFSLESLKPPFDAGGIADFVVIFPEWKLIEVVDLKGGRGHVVEVEGNQQARTYALGAILKHKGVPVEQVMSTIVQPRAPHKSGRIRSETIHVADLMDWTFMLTGAMRLSKAAIDALPTMARAEWASTFLNAGDHCKFCKAKATCPAIEQKVLDAAGVWLDDESQPHLANDPSAEDPERLSQLLDMLDMIDGWCNAVRQRAHDLADSGLEIPNYILVPRQTREKWSDDAESVIGSLIAGGEVAVKTVYNPAKLKTPKQVRKALGAQADLVDGLSHTPDGGTNLVRADKTTRAPAAPAVTRFLEPINEGDS